jgi:hypothetical protein
VSKYGAEPTSPKSYCPYPPVDLLRASLRKSLESFPATVCNQDLVRSFFAPITWAAGPPEPVPCLWEQFCGLDLSEEVVLIYWPTKDDSVAVHGGVLASTTVTDSPGKPREFTTSAITFRGQDLQPLAQKWSNQNTTHKYITSHIKPYTLSGPFVFTSPTVYLAHRPISITEYKVLSYPATMGNEIYNRTYITNIARSWSEDSRSAGVIPLSSSQVYTLRRVQYNPVQTANGMLYAQLNAKGKFMPVMPNDNAYMQAYPLRYSDLQDPVPASAYYDARWDDCWGEQTHCGTITDDSFRPKLSIHTDVWKSMFPQMPCHVPDLVDPPIALQELPRDQGLKAPALPSVGPEGGLATYLWGDANSLVHIEKTASPGNTLKIPLPTATPGPGSGGQHQGLDHTNPFPGPFGLGYDKPDSHTGNTGGAHQFGSQGSRFHQEEGDGNGRNESEGPHNEGEPGSHSRGGENSDATVTGSSLGGDKEVPGFDEGNSHGKTPGLGGEVFKAGASSVRWSLWTFITTFCAGLMLFV